MTDTQSATRWRRIAIALAVAGAAVSLAGVAIGVLETDAMLAGMAFLGWALLPAVVCVLLAATLRSPRALRVHTAVTTLVIGFQLAVYLSEQMGRPDAQGALVYAFVPLYQLVALAAATAGYAIARLVRRAPATQT